MTSTKTIPKAACVLCINPSTGHVLAATRPNQPTNWGLIGGKVDPGEGFREAAHREFFEETGVALTCELEYITTMVDAVDYEVAVYRVPSHAAHYVAHVLAARGQYSVEPNIFVNYVPMIQVCSYGPFQEFNSRLLSLLLAESMA